MRKLVTLIIFCVAAITVRAQFPHPDTTYFFLFGNTDVEEFRDVCNHSIDSGYVAVGTTSSFTFGSSDIYLVKSDWRGNTVWSRNIGSTAIENGYAVKETWDKGFIIGGFTNNTANGDYDMLLTKTDSMGWVQWQKRFGGTDWDFMYSLAVAPDSGFVLCGETYSFGNNASDVYVVRTDKDGNLVWERNWGGAGKDAGNEVIQCADSNFVVCGYTESYGAGAQDAYVLKIKYSDGDTLFTKYFGGALNENFNSCMEHKLDSGYIFIGSAESFSPEQDKEVYLLKVDRQGSFMWEHVYGEQYGEDVGFGIAETTFNNLFCVAHSPYGGGKKDVWAFIANVNGYGFWSLFSPTYGGAEDDTPYACMMTNRTDYLIAGSTESFGNLNADAMLILCDSIKSQDHFDDLYFSSDSLVTVEEPAHEKGIILFPNPSGGNVNVFCMDQQLQGAPLTVTVSDLQGREISQHTVIASQGKLIELSNEHLESGMYLVRVTGAKCSYSLPFILNR